jgi:chaperonin GroES
MELSTTIPINKDTIKSPNLAEMLDADDLVAIGNQVCDDFERDLESRDHWRRRSEAALDLAMQIQKDKTFPWPNCRNIAFPLVTIAALQFHSRAYPAIINGRQVVNCRVIGDDPDGALTLRAARISTHMSWQLLEQDENWEAEQDRALLTVPIVGTAFKKSYYSGELGHNVSELVLAKDLVLNYWAKSVESCPIKSHIIPLFRNDIYERVQRGTFCDILGEEWYISDAPVETNQYTQSEDNRRGQDTPQTSQTTPFTFIEQHRNIDLDGDGYEEPVIVTVEVSSRTVVRIVYRFDREDDVIRKSDGSIIRINALEYFTKIPFIPSPDGGIMDIGFGVLLGPLNESVNTAMNQLFDAGTLVNTAGGFLGRGAKLRGGRYNFSPFQWNPVDATGDDLRKSIFPLPVREPSAVMFNLLSLIIDYTNRISGATDMLTGVNPGQNTPAETSRAMVEQGQKVYSAIFKRIWRSMKAEFKKLYILNAIYLPTRTSFGQPGNTIGREDYLTLPSSVVPVADPTITSDAARFSQATLLKQAAMNNRGYNPDAVEKFFLKALQIDSVDLIYPGLEKAGPPEPDVKVQIQQLKNQQDAAELQFKVMSFVATMQEQRRMNTAKIIEMAANAQNLMEQARNDADAQKIQAFNAAIGALKEDNVALSAQINQVIMQLTSESSNVRNEQAGDILPPGTVSSVEGQRSDQALLALGRQGAQQPQGGVGQGGLVGSPPQ